MTITTQELDPQIPKNEKVCFTQSKKVRLCCTSAQCGGARVAQWWEHSPPTNVARVRILASTPYVGWVCCWFSPLLREVFLWVLQFSPLLKNQHFQNPIRSGTHGHVSASSYELLSVPWVNKLQITITIPTDMYWLIFFSVDRPNDGWNDYHQLKLNTNQESGLKRHFKAALLWARGIFVLGCRTVGSSLVPPDKLQT